MACGVGQIRYLIGNFFSFTDDFHQSADGFTPYYPFQLLVGILENVLKFHGNTVLANLCHTQVVTVRLNQILKGRQDVYQALFQLFYRFQVPEINLEINTRAFDLPFCVVDYFGGEQGIIGNENHIVIVIQQMNILQRDINDFAARPV